MVVTGNKIDTTNFKEIYERCENGAWVRLLWQDHGRVVILSDYGNWAYYWGHRGDCTVEAFLAKLNMDYMGGKMLGSHLREYCPESTMQCIREKIIQCRRDGAMTKNEARFEKDLIDSFDEFGGMNRDEFLQWGDQTHFFNDDWYESSRDRICSEWQNFWERLWVPHVQPILKECS